MLVLASKSPRRQEILSRAGIDFILRPAAVHEGFAAEERPRDHVCRLAREKAEAAAVAPGEILLGADTVVLTDTHFLKLLGNEATAFAIRLAAAELNANEFEEQKLPALADYLF